MNETKDRDLRESLRRREAKRTQPKVPTNFCEDVLREIGNKKPHTSIAKRARVAALILSASAMIAIVSLFPWHKPKQPNYPIERVIVAKKTPTKQELKENKEPHRQATPQPKSDKQVAKAQAKASPTPSKERSQRSSLPTLEIQEGYQASLSNIDSLQYFIDKIEKELAHVDESLYIERMNKVIQADDRLQRIVNQFILHGIMSDEKPHTVQSLTPQNQEENEE